MSKDKRLKTLVLSQEIEDGIYKLRQKDEYVRYSFSELMRKMIMKGLASEDCLTDRDKGMV